MKTSIIIVKLAPVSIFRNCSSQYDVINAALLNYSSYELCPSFFVNASGEKGADEVFDLTNNPSRDKERTRVYDHRRSVSVGDIVEVDGVDFLCISTGWTRL